MTRRLSWHPIPHDQPAPDTGGCYAVFMDGALAYIGSALSLRKRLFGYRFWFDTSDGQYSTPWGRCDHLEIRVRESRFWGDWATRELRLIRRLAPPKNRVFVRQSDAPGSDGPVVWRGHGACNRTLDRKTMLARR